MLHSVWLTIVWEKIKKDFQSVEIITLKINCDNSQKNLTIKNLFSRINYFNADINQLVPTKLT